jgi:hypothetical protein
MYRVRVSTSSGYLDVPFSDWDRATEGAHAALDAFEHSDDRNITVAMIDDDQPEPVFQYTISIWPGLRALLKSKS